MEVRYRITDGEIWAVEEDTVFLHPETIWKKRGLAYAAMFAPAKSHWQDFADIQNAAEDGDHIAIEFMNAYNAYIDRKYKDPVMVETDGDYTWVRMPSHPKALR